MNSNAQRPFVGEPTGAVLLTHFVCPSGASHGTANVFCCALASRQNLQNTSRHSGRGAIIIKSNRGVFY